MEEDFSIRLQKAMNIRNIKASELSEKAHIPKSAISQYLSGLYEAKQKSIFKLATVLDVNEGWLMGLDVSMERETKTDVLGNPVISIPILGTVKAGCDYLAQENWIGTVDIDKKLAKSGEFFALRIKGNSMFETLWENDIVAVKKQDTAENKDIVVALINGDEATVKQYIEIPSGIILRPLNKIYDDLIFTKEEIESKPVKIIGVVKRLIERDL